MKLSILVLSVHTRYNTFLPKIEKQLFEQYEGLDDSDKDKVEIIVLTDNKKSSVGEKRNALLDLAKGEYVQFVDDDDRVSSDFISTLLKETYKGSDCIVFRANVSINNSNPKTCFYSITNKKDFDNATGHYRIPNHISCVKASIAKKVRFPNSNFGEDADYSKRLLEHLKTETNISKILYYYDYNSETSETQGVNQKPPLVDIIFLSNATNNQFKAMTQMAIDTAIEGAKPFKVNPIVMEQTKVKYKNAKTINHDEIFNYNRMANIGAAYGTSEWIMVANNDLHFTKNWLQPLINANNALVSPIAPGDIRQKSIRVNSKGYSNGVNFSGWCFMINRKTYEKIVKFDDVVNFWCSDDVVIEQVKAIGVTPMVVPASRVKHFGSQTFNTVGKEKHDDMTWQQVFVFNEKYKQNKFAGNKWYEEWKKVNGK